MKRKQKKLPKLSDADKLAIAQAVYGEAAGADDDVRKMVIQSILGRAASGRSKEFGGTIPEILNKGYYAVSNPNQPYKEATSGEFSPQGKRAFATIQKQMDAIIGDNDIGDTLFYFTNPEEVKLRKTPKKFNFKNVRKTGTVDKYNTYAY